MSWESLREEMLWITGGMDSKLSQTIDDITTEAHQHMYEIAAKDTYKMSRGFSYEIQFLKGRIYSNNTHYALFNDGAIPLTIPYTTTPFIIPTVEFIHKIAPQPLLDVVAEKRGNGT